MLVAKVTLRLAIACSCVAFSSTLPEMKKVRAMKGKK